MALTLMTSTLFASSLMGAGLRLQGDDGHTGGHLLTLPDIHCTHRTVGRTGHVAFSLHRLDGRNDRAPFDAIARPYMNLPDVAAQGRLDEIGARRCSKRRGCE